MLLTKKSALVAAAIVSLTFLFVGCNNEGTVEQTSKALPKLDFHKPDSFAAAIGRIREIHDAIVSEEALPKSISYTVVEVSHSHGEGNAHVHYHLDKPADHGHGHDHGDGHDHGHDHADGHDHGHDHDDGHDHGHDHGDGHDHDDHGHDHGHDRDPFKADPKKHTVTVDIFTELNDIVRWLPKIASDGDLPQDEWKQTKSLSEEMTGHLEATLALKTTAEQRTNYQSDPSSMEKWIGELEQLVTSTAKPPVSE